MSDELDASGIRRQFKDNEEEQGWLQKQLTAMEIPLRDWVENRKLIVSQLSVMDKSINDLGGKIETFHEANRSRTTDIEKDLRASLTEMTVRIAMLEVRAKIWGGIIGLATGSGAALVIDLISHGK